MTKTYISEHFTLEECTCHCGCGYHGYPAAVVALAEKVRDILCTKMNVHCVARCKKHNAATPGSSPNSQHLVGHAMDFDASGYTPKGAYDAIIAAYKQGDLPALGGIGVYNWGVHIDVKIASDGHLRTWDSRK